MVSNFISLCRYSDQFLYLCSPNLKYCFLRASGRDHFVGENKNVAAAPLTFITFNCETHSDLELERSLHR